MMNILINVELDEKCSRWYRSDQISLATEKKRRSNRHTKIYKTDNAIYNEIQLLFINA